MTALPRNQYSTTFSLDGIGSPSSPHRGRPMPATFQPVPLKHFTVAVSLVPAALLQHSAAASAASSARPMNAAAAASAAGGGVVPLDGAGGAAAVGGMPSMASSIPVGIGGSSSSGAAGAAAAAGMLVNASFGPASSSFALTKSFGDVFTLKKTAAASAFNTSGGSGGSMFPPAGAVFGTSGRANSSFDSTAGLGASSSAAAAAAAAAAVRGHADPTASQAPVPNSRDAYRVHLLLPADYRSTAPSATPLASSVAAARSSSAVAESCPPQQSDAQLTGAEAADAADALAAATAPLEALRTAKRRQAAQVSEHWTLFQQLVRFVLSVAPRFEPPPTPPGFAFPVDLGLSFVQNSTIFSAAEATQQGRHPHASARLGSASSSSFAGPPSPVAQAAEDTQVLGAEREARRAYMEAYLNAALNCDQVNCLKELQAFVGYDAYMKNELAQYRAMSRVSSSNSLAHAVSSSAFNNHHHHHQPHHQNNGSGSGSRAAFAQQGPLGSSAHSTTSRSQSTAATSLSGHSNTAESVVSVNSPLAPHRLHARLPGQSPCAQSAAAAVPTEPSEGCPTTVALPPPPQQQQHVGGFSASPPVLARSLPPSVSPPLAILEDSQVFSSTHVPAALPGADSSSIPSSGRRGVVEVIDFGQNGGGGGGGSGAPQERAGAEARRPAPFFPSAVLELKPPPPPPSLPQHSQVPASGGPAGPGAAPLAASHSSVCSYNAARPASSALLSAVEVRERRQRHGTTNANSIHNDNKTRKKTKDSSSSCCSSSSSHRHRHRRGKESSMDGSLTSSHSAVSSFGSSVSHPGSARRRKQHRWRINSDEDDTPIGEKEGDGEAAAVLQLPPTAPLVTATTTTTNASAVMNTTTTTTAAATATAFSRRSALKSLVSIAPETERMLAECFRMMDTTGSGYVSAADCLVFYLCATPDSFAETLRVYADAATTADNSADAQTRQAARLEGLVPAWMRECEGVVVDHPDYLMSCARFVDAVREVLAVAAAMELTFGGTAAGTAAAAAGASGSHAVAASASTHMLRGRAQGSAGAEAEAASRHHTPASSVRTPSALPSVLAGSRPGDGTPLHFTAADSLLDETGTHHGSLYSPSPTYAASVPAATSPASCAAADESEAAAAAAAAPVVALETWIDNYWLLMYAQLYHAAAALIVGPEAAELRAALLVVREKAYLEMAARVATVGAAASSLLPAEADATAAAAAASLDPLTAAAASSGRPPSPLLSSRAFDLVCPPWLLGEVAAALAAQPPILGRFDLVELLSLLFVMGESGVAVAGVDDLLQWLGTRSSLAHQHLSLDEFASMLDVLSCSIPFADILHCVRRCWSAPSSSSSSAAAAADTSARPLLSSHPTHLLRLVSRCAAAEPLAGREFNEVVHDHRWRRGEHGCSQCVLSRGVMGQQAALLEALTEENAMLRQRVAALEAAGDAAGARVVDDGLKDRGESLRQAPAAEAPMPLCEQPAAEPTPVAQLHTADSAAGVVQTVTEAPSPLSSQHAPAATATATASSVPDARTPATSITTTIELIPTFTQEAGDSDTPSHPRRSAASSRAAVTRVACAGPLLYTVPRAYAQQPPMELEVSFYLCRAACPVGAAAAAAGTAVGSPSVHQARGTPGMLVAASAAAPAAPTERLTVRDGDGRRIVGLKLSNGVLCILGRDPAPVQAGPPTPRHLLRLPSSHVGATESPSRAPSSPLRHPHSQQERGYTSRVVGREQNILYPSCEDGDWESESSPYTLFGRGQAEAAIADHHGDPYRGNLISNAGSSSNVSAAARSAAPLAAAVRASPSAAPDGRYVSRVAAAAAAAEAPRVVSRVSLETHTWYTLRLCFDWQAHAVDVAVSSIPPTTASSSSQSRSSASGGAVGRRVFEGRVRMLDASAAPTVHSIDVVPRREMLVAYCNVLMRYSAEGR